MDMMQKTMTKKNQVMDLKELLHFCCREDSQGGSVAFGEFCAMTMYRLASL